MRDLRIALDLDQDLYARVEQRFAVWAADNTRLLRENAALQGQLIDMGKRLQAHEDIADTFQQRCVEEAVAS
jgi:hypothetical protein